MLAGQEQEEGHVTGVLKDSGTHHQDVGHATVTSPTPLATAVTRYDLSPSYRCLVVEYKEPGTVNKELGKAGNHELY